MPPTANHWESAYLAPRVELARGWLRQLDTTRDNPFYGDEPLTAAAYSSWLRDNAIRFVALPDAPLDYSSEAERRLILRDPPYLTLRWRSPDWRVYAVRDPEPLVDPIGAAAARVRWIGEQSFALDVSNPGRFLVRVNFTQYWSIARGEGCLVRHGNWTLVRADRPGRLPRLRRLLARPRLERGHRRPQDLLTPRPVLSITASRGRHNSSLGIVRAPGRRALRGGRLMRARNSAPWAP